MGHLSHMLRVSQIRRVRLKSASEGFSDILEQVVNMGTDASHERQQAHQLLDLLPQEKLTVVRGLLEVMAEPVGQPWFQSGKIG
jgi:hypothetical protein